MTDCTGVYVVLSMMIIALAISFFFLLKFIHKKEIQFKNVLAKVRTKKPAPPTKSVSRNREPPMASPMFTREPQQPASTFSSFINIQPQEQVIDIPEQKPEPTVDYQEEEEMEEKPKKEKKKVKKKKKPNSSFNFLV
jgi:hypothetical protein